MYFLVITRKDLVIFRLLSRYYEKKMLKLQKNYFAARVVRTRVICLVVLASRDDPCIKQVPVLNVSLF